MTGTTSTVPARRAENADPGSEVAGNVWRLLETPADSGVHNMAIDMALVDSVRATGQPALRFYRWWPPCLSFGRNQPARDRYDEREAERRRIDFVRRPTGGRPVYHHHEITYSLSVPDKLLGGPRRTYEAIHKALLAGLRLLGAATDIVEASGPAPRPSTLPCFQELDRGAIVSGKRKLVGSAQLREKGVLLQHGSLLLTGDQATSVELLRVRHAGDLIEYATALDQLLEHLPTWSELVDALAGGFERLLGVHLEESSLNTLEHSRTIEHSRRFSDPRWTWRL